MYPLHSLEVTGTALMKTSLSLHAIRSGKFFLQMRRDNELYLSNTPGGVQVSAPNHLIPTEKLLIFSPGGIFVCPCIH
jgi:hypothetical protein